MNYTAVRLIIIKDKKVLLVKEKNKDYWGFPGGGVELVNNEKVEDALHRELKEELSVNINNFGYYYECTNSWWKEGDFCTDIFYLGNTEGELISDNEIERFEWFDYSFHKYNLPLHPKANYDGLWEKLLKDNLISPGFDTRTIDIDKIKHIAEEASKTILKYYKDISLNVEYKTSDQSSPVTIADKETDLYISNELKKLYPDFGIVSEEINNDWKEYTWCVDPIDGTKAFIKGNGYFQILIGLLYKNIPIFGFIYKPTTGEYFFGGKNIEAFYINKKKTKLKVMNNKHEGNVLIISRDRYSTTTQELYPNIKFQNIFGTDKSEVSHKHMFMFIALNEANLRIEPRKGIFGVWDLCAPQAILESAGGKVSSIDGKPLEYIKGEKFIQTGFIAADSKERIDDIVKKLKL